MLLRHIYIFYSYLTPSSKPYFQQMEPYVAEHWKCAALRKKQLHEKGYFLVQFAIPEGRDTILELGLFSYNYRPLLLQCWHEKFCFEEDVMRLIPLSRRFPDLPLSWTEDSLSRLACVLGTPLYADHITSTQDRITYARVLAEIDITQPYSKEVTVENEKGNKTKQKVELEGQPSFRARCKGLDHTEAECNQVQ